MLTIEEIRRRMRDRKIPVVTQETGLHYNTVRRLVVDPEYIPSYQTAKAISDYLERNQ